MLYDVSKIVGGSGKILDDFVHDNEGRKISLTLVSPHESTEKVIIILPGTGANKDDSSKNLLIPRFLENQIAVLIFDMYGHGKTEGNIIDMTPSKVISEVEIILKYLKSRGFKKICLYASSWPALPAAIVASRRPEIIDLLVLQTMISDNDVYAEMTHGKAGLDLWKSQGYLIIHGSSGDAKIGYGFYKDSLQYNKKKYFKEIKAKTLGIIAGKDQFLHPSELKEVYKSIPNCQIEEVPEEDHLFTLYPESKAKLFDLVSHFVISNF